MQHGQRPRISLGRFMFYVVIGIWGLWLLGSLFGGNRGDTRAPVTAPSPTPRTQLAVAAPSTTAPTAGVAHATATPKPLTATPTPATATPEPPQKLKIGDTLEAKNWTVRVLEAQRLDALPYGSFGSTERPVGEWFVVVITLTNTGKENFATNTWDWELHLASGATINHSSELAALGHPEYRKMDRLGRQVPPTATVTIPLVYDIPKGATGIDLVFTQAKDRPVNVG